MKSQNSDNDFRTALDEESLIARESFRPTLHKNQANK